MTKLRTCSHCHLVFEGEGVCPACRRDPDTPPPHEPAKERRKTTEVPMIRKPESK